MGRNIGILVLLLPMLIGRSIPCNAQFFWGKPPPVGKCGAMQDERIQTAARTVIDSLQAKPSRIATFLDFKHKLSSYVRSSEAEFSPYQEQFATNIERLSDADAICFGGLPEKLSLADAREKAEQDRIENLPENLLGLGYVRYIFLKKCHQARDGYLLIYVSDAEIERARLEVRRIEEAIKEKHPDIPTSDLWAKANRRSQDFEVSMELCHSTVSDLDMLTGQVVPGGLGVDKDF